ncbi:transposable element Tcb2 transposase [Trichonephila clavipes]|nr:transposable element Tcb2 transposase [Trichonephila clavipes]
MWNVTDWQKVVFSDESRFVLGTDDNRVRVWRRPDSFMVGPLPDLSPVEHVWNQLKRKMPSCHSVHDLELAVPRFVGPSASGQHKHDNDPKHTAEMVKLWLLYNVPNQLHMDPQSSDLNPIEHP